MAENKLDFEKQEERLRSISLRGLIGFFIAFASLLLGIFLAFYPLSFAVILALALGALAYRAPAVSLGLMFFLNLPGYLYQGGFPIGLVVVASLVFLAATVPCVGRPGACLVIAAGVIAALMMFTPIYFLSLPLLISVILFRTRGVGTGAPGAIAVMLTIFVPFLALGITPQTQTDIVPLFQEIPFEPRDPISVIEFGQIFNQLKNAVGSSANVIKNLTFYIPMLLTEYENVVLVGRPLGFVLFFVIALAISVAFGTLSIFRWMESNAFGPRYLNWIAPTLSLLMADAAFLVPTLTLDTSFAYTTTLQGNIVALFVLATLAIGLAGSAIEWLLKSRDITLEQRQRLTVLIPEVRGGQHDLEAKLSSIRTLATQVDFHAEEKLLAMAAQETGYMEDRVGTLPAPDLEAKINTFSDLEKNLQKAHPEAEQKLLQYYDESREKYETFLARATDLGVTGIEAFRGKSAAELATLGFERAKEEQARLNEAFDKLGASLVALGKETAELISTEVDQEFKPFGLDIAQNYLTTGHSQEAIDSMLSTFLTMRDILDKAATGVAPKVEGIVQTWESAIKAEAVPTLRMMGDEEFAEKMLALKPALDNIVVSDKEEKYFAKLISLVKSVKTLNEAIRANIARLLVRIRDREEIIESKVPPGFDWERNIFLPQKISDVRDQLARKPKEASLPNRLANIELAVNALCDGVALIKQYIFENEFLINFSNIQYLISLKVQKDGSVATRDLPVKDKYAHRYLVLYARNHYDRVVFDSQTGVLTTLDQV